MSETLVIRFGSLGDLCLLGRALAEHRDERNSGPAASAAESVTLVTKPDFAELMGHVRGVDTVLTPAGTSATDVARLARSLQAKNFDTILDAHNILRSHLLLGLMGRRPTRRLAKDTAARLLFLRTGKGMAVLQRTMMDRFQKLLALPDRNPGAAMTGHRCPPLADLVPAPAAERNVLGIAPGAQWDSKRWPAAHFSALIHGFHREKHASIRIFLGPREEAWFSGSVLQALADQGLAEVVRGRSLVEVGRLLAGCRILVTNDSGLLHLAEAVGTPVLAFFGPTVREFGYFPHLPASRSLETNLACRPCSRNGKRPCHRGDLACLAEIQPATALTTLLAMWSDPSLAEKP